MKKPPADRPARKASRKPAPRRQRPRSEGRPPPEAEHHRRTRQAHLTEVAEDYVEVIADLIHTDGEARAVDIARRLGVRHVTVVKTIARLQRDGWVTARPYRSIFLTTAGENLAQHARHRHETVLRFLIAIGVSEPTARADAEGIEHHVSDETLAAFRRITDHRA